MRIPSISVISGIALTTVLTAPGIADTSEKGRGIQQDALSSEQVRMVQEHCEALLSEQDVLSENAGAASSTGDEQGGTAPLEPSVGDLADDPKTESELADKQGTSPDIGDDDDVRHGEERDNASSEKVGANDVATTSEGKTSADAVISDNGAAPAGAEMQELDLSIITAQDCIDAGIPG